MKALHNTPCPCSMPLSGCARSMLWQTSVPATVLRSPRASTAVVLREEIDGIKRQQFPNQ